MSTSDTSDQAAKKACDLYEGGNKCDKATLKVMQEVLDLPEKDLWLSYVIYENLKSQGCPRICNALLAGAAVIYTDIINKEKSKGDVLLKEVQQQYPQRATALFNAFKERFGNLDCPSLLDFDLDKYDEYPREKQDYIGSGEWMDRCYECIAFVITKLCENQT
jgi:hypothetical protein